jgi:hypothetical protein
MLESISGVIEVVDSLTSGIMILYGLLDHFAIDRVALRLVDQCTRHQLIGEVVWNWERFH